MELKKYLIKIIFSFVPILFIIVFYHFNIYSLSIKVVNKNLRFLKLYNEEEGEIVHLIKFNFTTKHNPKEIENPLAYLILNDITIPINLGTPNQTILASLRFNDYPFFLSSSSIALKNEEDKHNIFIKNNSLSYRFIASDMLFYKSILVSAERVNETFYFNDNTNSDLIKIDNFTFYYATKMNYNQSGGVVGLLLEDSNMNLHSGMNFFTQLKRKNVISYKTFSISYNKNKEDGEFIIGAYPHEYMKNKYKYENYHEITGYTETTFKIYGIIFDEIYLGENKMILNITKNSEGNKKEMTADLKVEFGFILAPSELEENITKEFIDLYKCNAYIANFQEIYGSKLFLGENFKYYICENSYKTESKLSFLNKEMEYIIELDYNDLFVKYGNKTYFNIIFLSSGYKSRSWIFGKPIFLKYKWVFDPDKKILGFYDNKVNNVVQIEKNNNLKMIIILIISIIIFLGVLIVFIYEFLFKKKRKNRPNEILEDYDYQNTEENKIIPNIKE